MADEPDGIYINGEVHDLNSLTFREKRLIHKTLRELNDDVEDYDPAYATHDDLTVATVYVIAKRSNPDVSMDQILDMKDSDLVPPEPKANGGGKRGKRPTKAATAA